MKYTLLLVLLLVLVSCYNTERDCAQFKTGAFRFEADIEGKKLSSEITRNDSIEVENFNGKIDTSAIRWVSDCEYILTKLKPKNRAEARGVAIKIITTDAEGYQFEFGEVGNTKKFKGRATKK